MSWFCGVGQMQQICGFWDHSKCPCCQQENETTSHVLLCQGKGADSEWKDRILHLGLWLSEVNMHPSIHQCLINSVSQQMDTTTFVSNADPLCMNAAIDQDEIG
jgi:hypothetical protein